jgi:hypothetical protein
MDGTSSGASRRLPFGGRLRAVSPHNPFLRKLKILGCAVHESAVQSAVFLEKPHLVYPFPVSFCIDEKRITKKRVEL